MPLKWKGKPECLAQPFIRSVSRHVIMVGVLRFEWFCYLQFMKDVFPLDPMSIFYQLHIEAPQF